MTSHTISRAYMKCEMPANAVQKLDGPTQMPRYFTVLIQCTRRTKITLVIIKIFQEH